MKKGLLLTIVVLLGSAAAWAQEDGLGVELDLTWVSKYLWRGIDMLDDKAAFQPSVKVDLPDSGFSFKFWASYAGSSKGGGAVSTVNATEYEYILAYEHMAFEGDSLATAITANYIYYDFIDQPSIAADAQELGVGFAWPNICPAGIVPSYYVGKIWPSDSDSALTGEYGGWVHIFGLGYDMEAGALLPGSSTQVLHLSAAAVYNDGFAGATVDHDWSHILWGVSTSMELGPGSFAPALYYQTSMDDSVNTEDEFWTSLSYKMTF
jgi:hypothetical protein